MSDKKCKWTAPNGQEYECIPSIICGDCINGKGKRLFYKDIYAIKDGLTFWIECKRPVGGVLSVDQRNFLDAMNRHGAVGIVVNSIESLELQLKEAGVNYE